MQKLILLLMLLLPVAAFSQVNQTDPQGLRQGKWEKTYPNGRPLYQGYFKDGKPVGEWLRYHENGQVKARISYVENPDSAHAQLFDVRGMKIAEGAYVHEKKEGKWLLFSENVKVAEEEYKNNVKHGISLTFYSTGEILEKSEWKHGLQDGNYEAFFKSGEPYMQCKFSEGKRNGLCISRYQSGRVEMEANYKDNLRQGEWKFYDVDGKHLYTLIYNEGMLLNPEVRDSVDNRQILNLETNRQSIPDPEKFMEDPSEYMLEMQKIR